jgi:hypothetical protein
MNKVLGYLIKYVLHIMVFVQFTIAIGFAYLPIVLLLGYEINYNIGIQYFVCFSINVVLIILLWLSVHFSNRMLK